MDKLKTVCNLLGDTRKNIGSSQQNFVIEMRFELSLTNPRVSRTNKWSEEKLQYKDEGIFAPYIKLKIL